MQEQGVIFVEPLNVELHIVLAMPAGHPEDGLLEVNIRQVPTGSLLWATVSHCNARGSDRLVEGVVEALAVARRMADPDPFPVNP